MKTLITALLIFMAVQVHGQYYQILHVKGEISIKASGKLLKPGDQLMEDEEISFKTSDAMAAALNPEKGRFIIKSDSEKGNTVDIFYVLKSTITPVRGGMSTRAGGINNAFDLKVYFAEAPYIWAGKAIFLPVSKAAFPLDDSNFFFLRYQYKGEEINKKLGSEANSILMNKMEVFQVDDDAVDRFEVSDYQLFYYQAESEESTLIADIDFVLISQEVLVNIYDAFKSSSKYPYNDVADMLSDMYGKCDPVQVRYNIQDE